MNERSVLIVLLLLAIAAAVYIWGVPGKRDDGPKSAEKAEVEQRTTADPFPATDR